MARVTAAQKKAAAEAIAKIEGWSKQAASRSSANGSNRKFQ
jgi:hypothetical protein